MDDFNSLPTRDWYALGSLLAQFAFLAAAVWFARNFLQTVRAFQEQIGALLKLSMTAAPGERQSSSTIARNSVAEAGPYWLPLSESRHANHARAVSERGPNPIAGSWRRLLHWLQEPMSTSQVSYRRRLIHWLQAPAGS